MVYNEFFTWLTEVANLSRITAVQYELRIQQINRGPGSPENLSPEVVIDFIGNVSEGRSINNYNHWTSSLKKYHKYLVDTGKETTNFLEGLSTKPLPRRLPTPLSEGDINSICGAIPNDLFGRRDRAIIELLYSGLRNSECSGITITDLFDRTVRVIGKGNKERLVPLNDVAWDKALDTAILFYGGLEALEISGEDGQESAFESVRKKVGNKPLFLTTTGHQIYPRAIRRMVKKYASIAGVSAHPHMFRHSFATHLLDEGLGNLMALKDSMGHSKIDTTALYVLVSGKSRDLLKSFHPRQKRRV